MDPEKRGKGIGLEDIFIWLVVLLGVILLVNITITFSLNNDIKKNEESVKEKSKPAKIELAVVRNSKCNDCSDISAAVSYVKDANLNVTGEAVFEFDSKEGMAVISKYKIDKVPALVITGEIEKVNIEGFEKREDALLLAGILPPYTNALTGAIEGRVILQRLTDLSCGKCSDLALLISQIKAAGVKVVEEKAIE